MSKQHGGKRPGAGRPKINGGAKRILITITKSDYLYLKQNFDGISLGIRELIDSHRSKKQPHGEVRQHPNDDTEQDNVP